MPDIISILFATLYLLGAILHYLHVMSVMYLSDNLDNLSRPKLYLHTATWPLSVIGSVWDILTTPNEDDEENQ